MSDSHRLLTPRQDRAVLSEPPRSALGALIERNRRLLSHLPGSLLGRPWPALRQAARQSALKEAQAYLGEAGEPLPSLEPDSVVLSGHQPELFHPGVWVKNFALNAIARAYGAMPINLVVDNDAVKNTALRLPEFVEDRPRVAAVPFDRWLGDVPYEELAVYDERVFKALPEGVRPITARWGFQPMLGDFWREALRQGQRTHLLGERFAAARRTFERAWGCHNLELPISRLCRTEPFHWFVGDLLAQLPRFHTTYNACLRDYRRRYHIRSRHHPVPELLAEEDWLEVPLWGWRAAKPRRGRLMARRAADHVALRVGVEAWPSLPSIDKGPAKAVEALADLERRGYKVRSRAVTNTLYGRLFLGDLFIHGIGGGKYDELTDDLIRSFYGFEPPGYQVLSATLLLPFRPFPASASDLRRLKHELHDLRTNPQRHLCRSDGDDSNGLAQEKQAWIARQPSGPAERRERFKALKALTRRLQPAVSQQEQHVATLRDRAALDVAANQVLSRRDYAFCLYPEADLRPFCQSFLALEREAAGAAAASAP